MLSLLPDVCFTPPEAKAIRLQFPAGSTLCTGSASLTEVGEYTAPSKGTLTRRETFGVMYMCALWGFYLRRCLA